MQRQHVRRHLVGKHREVTDRLTDDALWASVAATIREVLLPAIDDPWARQSAIQLVGLAEYARRRGQRAPTPDDVTESVRTFLDEHRHVPTVAQHWPGADHDPLDAAAEILARAQSDGTPVPESVRSGLRALLIADLDHQLETTAVLIGPFRGKLPERASDG